jgi:hypothetical protein
MDKKIDMQIMVLGNLITVTWQMSSLEKRRLVDLLGGYSRCEVNLCEDQACEGQANIENGFCDEHERDERERAS